MRKTARTVRREGRAPALPYPYRRKKRSAYDDVEARAKALARPLCSLSFAGFPCLDPCEGRKNLDEEPTSLFVCSEPDSRVPSTAMTTVESLSACPRTCSGDGYPGLGLRPARAS